MVDEKRLAKTMVTLGMSREEVLEMWEADKEIDQGKPQDFDLTPEQEKNVKKLTKGAKKPANYSLEGAKKRERKPNDEKRAIIAEMASKLEDFHHLEEENPASGVKNVEIVNIEREITFQVGENSYSMTITCHRKPKK